MPGLTRLQALCAVAALAVSCAASAQPEPAQFDALEQTFAAELADASGLKREDILATLDQAHYQQSIIDAISRPAEAKPWKDYRPIFLTERRTSDGIAFLQANRPLLQKIQAQTGVPAALVVTILGVETNYGRITGRYRVLDALATLAFAYPPRADFFRGELKQLFLLRGPSFPYPLDQLNGSYAGAMGWGQFMPTSVAKFARDEDGDGKVDLWNSLPDICASVANYFVAHGWQKDGAVAVRAAVAPNARTITPGGLEPVYPLQQLEEWGYATADKHDPMTPATLITLDGADGPETWITFENFYAISRYNRSPLYSLAVYQLSQAIAAGAVDAAP